MSREKVKVYFANEIFYLLADACLYWPSEKTLIISDLHLEKGSYFASRNQPIPLYDTEDTLLRLKKIITAYQPETVICLGDNVHDGRAFRRMTTENISMLQQICQSVHNWLWIVGNHDKLGETPNPIMNMQFSLSFVKNNICFTHEKLTMHSFHMIGHFHPKVTFQKRGIHITGKCFVTTPNLLILPAFGSYTGGLDVESEAYVSLLQEPIRHYMIYSQQIWRVK